MMCGAEHLGLQQMAAAGAAAHELEKRISENVEKLLEAVQTCPL